MDYTLAGKRVKTVRKVNGYIVIESGQTGTIVYCQDNGLGTILTYVKWDNRDGKTPVISADIEIIESCE